MLRASREGTKRLPPPLAGARQASFSGKSVERVRQGARKYRETLVWNKSELPPADAGRFVATKIMRYDAVRDIAAFGAEVAPRPEVAAAEAFPYLRELHLHSVGGAPFDTPDEVADRDLRRYFHEPVYMLFRENTGHDFHTELVANLADDRPNSARHASAINPWLNCISPGVPP